MNKTSYFVVAGVVAGIVTFTLLLIIGGTSSSLRPVIDTSFQRIYAADLSTELAGNGSITVTGDGSWVLVGNEARNTLASTGRTGGAYISIDADFEELVSGETVRVDIRARSFDSARLATAYSTSEVGNSGWRNFNLGDEFEIISFEYDVPEMRNGNGDYLGFVAFGNDGASTIEIDYVTLTRLTDN